MYPENSQGGMGVLTKTNQQTKIYSLCPSASLPTLEPHVNNQVTCKQRLATDIQTRCVLEGGREGLAKAVRLREGGPVSKGCQTEGGREGLAKAVRLREEGVSKGCQTEGGKG